MYAADETYEDFEPYTDDLADFRDKELDEDAAAGEFDVTEPEDAWLDSYMEDRISGMYEE